MYKDNVLPNQRNGVYGHGRERYDAIEEILDANVGSMTGKLPGRPCRRPLRPPTRRM